MKRKIEKRIKRRINELWKKVDFGLKVFEEAYSQLKEVLEKRKLGDIGIVKMCSALMYLEGVKKALEDIELLEDLLEEDEGKNR